MKIGFLDMFMYLPILALIVGLGFVFFAEDRFRYKCQDPTFWGTVECEPPMCKAEGICTEDLIKFEFSTIEESVTEDVINEDEISNDLECNCREEDVNAQ